MFPHRILLWSVGFSLLCAAGCEVAPTYPKARVAESLQRLLAQEHVQASVRFFEHTLAVQLAYPDALALSGTGIGPAFDDAIRDTLPAIHRVLFSTDAEIRFYILLLSDPQAPGVYLTIVRYADDVRREQVNMLDTPEILSRTIFDLQYVGPTRSLTLERDFPSDIHLEDFLSWQLARRIQHALTDAFPSSNSNAVQVGQCDGAFERGEFAFTLNILPPEGTTTLDEATMRQIFHTSTSVIAKVLSSYQFQSFESVRLIHPLTGRNLVLPKAHLDVFR
jgi:hypothetical protein